MKICVLTQPGARGELEPCSFRLGGQRVPIVGILDRWRGPVQRFLVRDRTGRRFVLRQQNSGSWELEAVYGPAPRPMKGTPAAS
jgi:hypothetical protein